MPKIFHLQDNNNRDIEREGMQNPIATLQDKETALNYFRDQLGKKLSFTPSKEGDEPAYKFYENETENIQWTHPIEVYESQ